MSLEPLHFAPVSRSAQVVLLTGLCTVHHQARICEKVVHLPTAAGVPTPLLRANTVVQLRERKRHSPGRAVSSLPQDFVEMVLHLSSRSMIPFELLSCMILSRRLLQTIHVSLLPQRGLGMEDLQQRFALDKQLCYSVCGKASESNDLRWMTTRGTKKGRATEGSEVRSGAQALSSSVVMGSGPGACWVKTS